jgi:6-phosphogluconate dehydrogenase
MKFGMIGLGTMGRNLLLNMADHGYSVAGYDKNGEQATKLEAEGAGREVRGTADLTEFVGWLDKPRTVMMLVPAGAVVDTVIQALLPHLEAGDLIIDGGNSHFTDTERREKELAASGLHFFGMGISGGEAGARHGPSMMPGGDSGAYIMMQPVLEAIAAHVDGDPCVTYMGPRGAGHYVKMVHNGIEYGLMQLIAESYHLLKQGLGLDNAEIADIFTDWNGRSLNSFLVEITAVVLQKQDEQTGKSLVDMILDVAGQKGTGMWTSQEAMAQQVPIPTIDTAVAMRDLSDLKTERQQAAAQLQDDPVRTFKGDPQLFIGQLRRALVAAFIVTYAQGFSLLQKASQVYQYNLDLEAIARIWRGGCIIRAALLEDFRSAYQAQPDLANLLLADDLGQAVLVRQTDWRAVVTTAVALAIPIPAFSASLAYFDAYRTARLPANLIQAQRDYFGAHTYRRIDADGIFHTEWDE